MKSVFFGLAAAALSLATSATAQEYLPLPQSAYKEDKSAGSLLSLGLPTLSRLATMASSTGASGTPPLDPFKCSNPPAFKDLKTKINTKAMSTSAALSLGFPVAHVGGSTNSTVLIQDWSRVAPCLSNDGKTTLLFGQAVRVYTSISNTEASVDLTFPAIAAEATLNHKATDVQAELVAFNDQEAQKMATGLLGQLTVENFGEKNRIVGTLASRLVVSNSQDMALIGVQQEAPELRIQVASAFGIQQVSDGRSCADAKQRMKTADVEVVTAIETAYLALSGACGTEKPNPVAQATAQAALMGIKVK